MSADVSVIIPAYNASSTIVETLKSALEQSAAPLEILVIDDRSTDRTADIVNDLALKHPLIRLIRKPVNEGLSAARNTGALEARGAWVALLDADDLWTPDKLEAQLRFAAEHPNLSCIGCYFQELFSTRLGAIRQELFWPSALMIQRSVALDCPFNPEWTASETPEYWTRFDQKYQRGGVPSPMLQYRLSTSGIAHSKFFRERMAWLLVNENTRRRANGQEEVRYRDLERWYRSQYSLSKRIANSIVWRGDLLLRGALIHACEGDFIRAFALGIGGTMLNPSALFTKAKRLRSLRRSKTNVH